MLHTLAQALGALGGVAGLGGLLVVLAQRRLINAKAKRQGVDATAVLSETAIELLNEVRRELEITQSKVEALQEHVMKMEVLLREKGVTPPVFVWRPAHRLRTQGQ